jgi:hypothetical protein
MRADSRPVVRYPPTPSLLTRARSVRRAARARPGGPQRHRARRHHARQRLLHWYHPHRRPARWRPARQHLPLRHFARRRLARRAVVCASMRLTLARPTLARPMLGRPTLGWPTLGRPTLGRPTLGRFMLALEPRSHTAHAQTRAAQLHTRCHYGLALYSPAPAPDGMRHRTISAVFALCLAVCSVRTGVCRRRVIDVLAVSVMRYWSMQSARRMSVSK